MATPEGLVLADEVGKERGGSSDLGERLISRVNRWAAADRAASERCGEPVRTPVLIVVDRGMRYDMSAVGGPAMLEGFDVRLLVADAEPGVPVPPPPAREADAYVSLAGGAGGWLVLGSNRGPAPIVHARAEEAARHVATEGYPRVRLAIDPASSWSLAVEGLDALAGIGVVPFTGFSVGEDPLPLVPAPPPPPREPTRLVLGDRIGVLAFEPPRYAQRRVDVIWQAGPAE